MIFEKNWKYRNPNRRVTFHLGSDFTIGTYRQHEKSCVEWDHENNSWILVVYEGFAWNGLSWMPDFFDSDKNLRASMAHDALYGLISIGHIPFNNRKYADRLFRRVLKEDGQGIIARSIMYFFVRWFAGFACKPGEIR